MWIQRATRTCLILTPSNSTYHKLCRFLRRFFLLNDTAQSEAFANPLEQLDPLNPLNPNPLNPLNPNQLEQLGLPPWVSLLSVWLNNASNANGASDGAPEWQHAFRSPYLYEPPLPEGIRSFLNDSERFDNDTDFNWVTFLNLMDTSMTTLQNFLEVFASFSLWPCGSRTFLFVGLRFSHLSLCGLEVLAPFSKLLFASIILLYSCIYMISVIPSCFLHLLLP